LAGAAAEQVVSTSRGTEDLHLVGGSGAIAAGENLSASFTNDIDDQTRPAAPAAWDIGADQTTP